MLAHEFLIDVTSAVLELWFRSGRRMQACDEPAAFS
jgi:hypothetical protein